MDRGAWRATVHGVTKNWTQLSNFHLCSSVATLASLLLLKPGDLSLASGSLHLLFCLPGVLFPQILHNSLSHMFHILVESRLGELPLDLLQVCSTSSYFILGDT